ncbi:MAG TPA: RraA family protein [Acidimicrobiales bacterium]|nr:RraA family protein [Acidimicrobiales bacterium]
MSSPGDEPLSPADASAALIVLGAATVGESGGEPMDPRIRPVWPGARLAAPAFPVRCSPGDNLAIHVAVAAAPPGSVLVVDVGGDRSYGYWGEVLTTAALARHLVGLVIDGGVRDTTALESHRFPVFSTVVALRGASKDRPGTVGEPVVVGDLTVHAGDWVVGDRDGVAVIGRSSLGDVLAAGRARADKEAVMFAELTDGRTTLELLGLDPAPVEVVAPGPGQDRSA